MSEKRQELREQVEPSSVGAPFVDMLGSIDRMERGVDKASAMLENRDQWMREWNDLIDIGAGSKDKSGEEQYDVSIFGPRLKSKKLDVKAYGKEALKLLLAKDSDFVDAMLTVDRDNFLADPHECAQRDCAIIRQLAGFIYTNFRDYFLTLPIEEAMVKIQTYKEHIRCLRSLLYMSNVLDDDGREMQKKIDQAEALKEKYEATIFTLRRQLQDMHAAANTVGRGVDGTVKAQDAKTVAQQLDFTDGTSNDKSENRFVVCIQIEELGNLRSRHRNVMDRAIAITRETICSLANAYDVERTNYVKSDEKDADADARENPTSFLFVSSEGFNAIGFATEAHVALNECEMWPQALVDMSRFGSELWHGLRVRVGVHYGVPNEMETGEVSAIMHYEGLAVEKSIRVAQLGVAGDTVVSQNAWEGYMQEVKEARVPPSKRYQNLRAMATESINCAKKRGFKKGEICTRCWPQVLSARQTQPIDADFSIITFYRLEANAVEEDDEEPTVEELLSAKDTEINLLQQELDMLRLDVIKRDTDLEEMKQKMVFTMNKIQEQIRVKDFINQNAQQSLESTIMEKEDVIASATVCLKDLSNDLESSLSSSMPASPSHTVVSLEEHDKRRKKMYIEWSKDITEVHSDDDDESPKRELGSRRGSKTGSHKNDSGNDLFKIPKHKNQKLWRELNGMVKGTTKKLVVPGNQRGIKRGNSSTNMHQGLFKLHNVVRVYDTLMRRFCLDGDQNDQDNQAITEEQFIALFVHKVTGEAQAASAREAMNLMCAAAIDNEEVELANCGDDSRMIRSIGGHLGKVFGFVRGVKKQSLMNHKLCEEANAKLAEFEATQETQMKKGKKKGSTAASAAPAQQGKVPSSTLLKPTNKLATPTTPAEESLTVPTPTNARRKSTSMNPADLGGKVATSGSESRSQSADKHKTLERENVKLQSELAQLKQQLKEASTAHSSKESRKDSKRSSISSNVGVGPAVGTSKTGKRASLSGAGAIVRAQSRKSLTTDTGCQTPTGSELDPLTPGRIVDVEDGENVRHVGVQVNRRGGSASFNHTGRHQSPNRSKKDKHEDSLEEAPPHRSSTFKLSQDWVKNGSGVFGGAKTPGSARSMNSGRSDSDIVATKPPGRTEEAQFIPKSATTTVARAQDPDMEPNGGKNANASLDIPIPQSQSPPTQPIPGPHLSPTTKGVAPRLGEHVPVITPRSELPVKEDIAPTEVEEFSMEQRHQQLKEKWAKEKEERAKNASEKHRQTFTPVRNSLGLDLGIKSIGGSPQGPQGAPVSENSRPSTSNMNHARDASLQRAASPNRSKKALHDTANEWQPKLTLAPLRTKPTAEGGLSVAGQLGVGAVDNKLPSTMMQAAQREEQMRREREQYDLQQEQLQKQLIQLKQLKEQSKQMLTRPGSRGEPPNQFGPLPSNMVVGNIGTVQPHSRVPSRQGPRHPVSHEPNTTIGYGAQFGNMSGGGSGGNGGAGIGFGAMTTTQLKPKSNDVSSIVKLHKKK